MSDECPINSQPTSSTILNSPTAGLEWLNMLDQILVHQRAERFEAMIGREQNNRYLIKNKRGHLIGGAKEQTDWMTRNCCGSIRPFDLSIKDLIGREMIKLHRPLNCNMCCFPCCMQKLLVFASGGTLVGQVEQQWAITKEKFNVLNNIGDVKLTIKGPLMPSLCLDDADFDIMSADGTALVGRITRQWTGLVRDTITDADHFAVTFPIDLDVSTKATLLGALFLIDFMHFESTNNNY